eukprot:343535-Hanusia_phi.AAC.3
MQVKYERRDQAMERKTKAQIATEKQAEEDAVICMQTLNSRSYLHPGKARFEEKRVNFFRMD